MTRRQRYSALLIFTLVLPALAAAPAEARVVVKMATLAPDGSVWDDLLSEMGAEWQEATGGEVALRIYAGGVAGDEPDLIRKMRIGQLHAAALTIGGLSELDPAFQIFEIPMFLESYGEERVREFVNRRRRAEDEQRGRVSACCSCDAAPLACLAARRPRCCSRCAPRRTTRRWRHHTPAASWPTCWRRIRSLFFESANQNIHTAIS